MEQDNISFSYGIRRTPSIGESGELSECVNLIPKAGELVNIPQPTSLEFDMYDREILLAVHETSKFKHYIIHYNNDVTSSKTIVEGDIKVYIVCDGLGTYIKLSEACDADVTISFIFINGRRKAVKIYTISAGETYIEDSTVRETLPNGIKISSSSTAHTFGEARTILTTDELEITSDTELSQYEEWYTKYNFTAIYWVDANGSDYSRVLLSTDNYVADINDVRIMGNTVIILTSEGIKYYLWDSDNSLYRALGSSVPEIDMKFRLDGTLRVVSSSNTIELDNSTESKTSYMEFVGNTINSTTRALYKIYTNTGVLSQTLYGYKFSPTTGLGLVKGKTYRINFIGTKTSSKIQVRFFTYKNGDNDDEIIKVSSIRDSQSTIYPGTYLDFYCSIDADGLFITYRNSYTGDKIAENWLVFEGTETTQPWTITYNKENTDAIFATANTAINEEYKQGKFVNPFFLRWGVELYDGTIIHHSSPILMIPNTGLTPMLFTPKLGSLKVTIDEGQTVISIKKDDVNSTSSYFASFFSADVLYYITEESLQKLKDWKDVVVGIRFYASLPIYKYNEGKSFTEEEQIWKVSLLNSKLLNDHFSILALDGDENPKKHYLYDEMVNQSVLDGSDESVYNVISLPEFSDSEYYKNIQECGTFHKIKDLGLDDIEVGEYKKLELSNFDISTLSTRESMADDYNSHSILIAKKGFVFNNRFSIANFVETIYPGENVSLQTCSSNDEESTAYWYKDVVTINDSSQIQHCQSDFITGDVWANTEDPYWIYVGNANAKSITVYKKDEDDNYYKATVELTRHANLNGSFWFGNLNALQFEELTDQEEAEITYDNAVIEKRNLIYTSEVNNPFKFDTSLSCSVGIGEVLGLSTTAKALSQGQFGDFPLYAFCSDGIWALSVGSEGGYEAVQPVSRDVVTNPDSITQIDGGIVFATKKGLMMISGSDVGLLSGNIDGLNVNETFFKDVIPSQLYIEDTAQFVDQVQTAKMAYDYANGMLHIFTDTANTDETYFKHYVYNFDTKEFSEQVLSSELTASVPGYPLSTLQFNSKLCQYTKDVSDNYQYGFLVTRSYSISSPFERKIIYDLRCFGQKTAMSSGYKVSVYVSNDNKNWYRLTSLKMKSARYYRFVIQTTMKDIDTLTGMTLQYDKRFNHKIK